MTVVGGSVLAAAPAQAATVTDASCTAGTGIPITGTPITEAASGTITITATLTSCDEIWVSTSLVDAASDIALTGGGTVGSPSIQSGSYVIVGSAVFTGVTITLSATATTSGIGLYNNGSGDGTDWVVQIGSSPTPSGSTSSTSSGPAPVVQQFGKPASLTCDEAQLEGLDWSGVASGGWGQSWAQWMNDGAGGAVCSRTLVYSANAGGWTVN